MSATKIHDTPSDVTGEAGEVIVDGPDGVAVSLTPDAGLETGSRLISAAAAAHGQSEIRKARKRTADNTHKTGRPALAAQVALPYLK